MVDPETLLSHRDFVRALARSLILDESRVDDVEQQTWMAALQSGPREPGSLRSWLAAVARNFARRALREDARRLRREEGSATPEPLPPADEFLAREALRRQVVDAVTRLSEPYRTVVLLRFFKELPPKRIAAELGVPLDTVKTRLKRGLALLRGQLDATHGGDRSAWCVAFLPLATGPVLGTATAATAGAIFAGVITMKSLWVTGGLALVALLATFGWLVRDEDGGEPTQPGDGIAREAAMPDAPSVETGALEAVTSDVERSEAATPATEARPATEPTPVDSERLPLSGIVTFPDGRAAAGVGVAATQDHWRGYSNIDIDLVSERRPLMEQITDGDGGFRFMLSPQLPVDLVVRANGYPDVTLPNCFGGETVSVRLQQGAHLFGRITRGVDGLPIAGARITGQRFGNPVIRLFEGVTDERGSFSFTGILPGNVQYEVISPRHMTVSGQVQLEPGQSVQRDLSLDEGITLRGRVIDASSGAPIPGAVLSHGWTFERTATSGPDGRYELPGFGAKGTYDVHVRASGYGKTETADMELDTDQEQFVLDFKLHRARQAKGRLIDRAGQPVLYAYVAAVANQFDSTRKSAAWWSSGTQQSDWRSARSDDEGRFVIEDLRPDARHALFVRADGMGVAVFDFPVEEFEQQVIDLGDLILEHAGVIFGQVVDEFERPVAETRVSLEGHGSDRFRLSGREEPWFTGYVDERETVTDSTGRFRFEQVAPGDYTATAGQSHENEGGPAPVTLLEPGQRVEVRVTATLGLAIAGRVTDPSGAAAVGALVLAQRNGEGMDGMTVVKADGKFRIDGLPPGEYTVQARPIARPAVAAAPRLRPAVVDGVPAGTSDLVLCLGLASSIEGKIVDAGGDPVSMATVTALDAEGNSVAFDLSEPTGQFSLDTPPGSIVTIEVQLTDPSDDPHRAFVIRENSPPMRFEEIAAGSVGLILRVETE